MSRSRSLFEIYQSGLLLLLVMIGATMAWVGLEVADEIQASRKTHLLRQELLDVSSRVRMHIVAHEFGRALALVRSVDPDSRGDVIGNTYVSALMAQFSQPAPDIRLLKAIAEGWQFHQSLELVRLSDDREIRLRGILGRGLLFWGVIFLVVLFLFRRHFNSVVRPASYLARYLGTLDLSQDLPALFSKEADRRRHGFESAPEEILQFERGTVALIEKLRAYQKKSKGDLLEQKARNQVLSRINRDGIFVLRGSTVVWRNATGARILEEEFHRGLHPVDLEKAADSGFSDKDNRQRAASAILTAASRWTPVELVVRSEDGVQIASYLVTRSSESSRAGDGRNAADTIVVAQDISWIRQGEEAKAHFLALLSHEVKTPVTSLLMATRLLQRSPAGSLTDVQRRLVDTSVRDVDRLRELIDELLVTSRFDLNSESLNLRASDLRRLLAQAVRAARSEAEQRQIRLELHFSETLGDSTVRVDPARLAWVLSSMLTEAVRHSSRGSRLQVGMVRSGGSSGSDFEIRICGAALQFPGEIQERLFERGFAHYSLRVARSNATGMSLAIAREVAIAHGGSLAMRTDQSTGTELVLVVPQSGHEFNNRGGGRNYVEVAGG